MVDIVKTPTPIAAPTVPHSVVSGSIGLFCSRCGETKDLMTTCVPAAAERAAIQGFEMAKINAAHAFEMAKINVRMKAEAKTNFGKCVTAVLIVCLSSAILRIIARDVDRLVRAASVVPVLNSSIKQIVALMGFLVGFAATKLERR